MVKRNDGSPCPLIVNITGVLVLFTAFVTVAAPVNVVTLVADDGEANSFFGFSVATTGETAVVGAHGDNANGAESGAIYVFGQSIDGWRQQTKLAASDAQPGDQFGGSVAISGDTILSGARGDDEQGDSSGAVYVFVKTPSGWVQQTKLTASDGSSGAEFGRSVAIAGNTAIVGAARDDSKGEDSGSAYLFTRSGTQWRQQSKLVASDAAAGDVFGISVVVC